MNGCKIIKGTRALLTCALVTYVLILSGCAEQQRSEEATEQVCFANLEKVVVMQAAEDVLAKMHFTIEKADAEAGLIRTRPLAGAQFFDSGAVTTSGASTSPRQTCTASEGP